MDRYAVFVDAGYFFAAGASAAFGRQVPRNKIQLGTPSALVRDLAEETARIACNLSLLRIYWYDAMPGSRLSLDKSSLAMLAGVKLRLGALNSVGEQKGVDSLIVTDLIELARNRAIADAVVVSGDEDLRIAIQVAQSYGVRVHILAAGDPRTNVSQSVQMEADSLHSLQHDWFQRHLVESGPTPEAGRTVDAKERTPSATNLVIQGDAAASLIEQAQLVSEELLAGATGAQLMQLKEHFASSKNVPTDFDRRLIAKVAAALGGVQLSGDQCRQVRGIFVRSVRDRNNPAVN